MAVHAGTFPGVRATEPMLMSAKEGPVAASTGKERGGEEKKSVPAAASATCKSVVGKKKVARHLLQSDMVQRVSAPP